MEQESRAVTQTLAFSEAEFNLYKFTFLQNAGYVIFLLLFNNFVEICNNGKEPASNSVLMETSLLFLAVLIGNFWSIYAGFESDARGHARCIRKSFDYGVIHGLFLAILPWLTTIIPGIYLYFSVFLAALFQAISSAYVNASYHAWFVASAHNLGYQGSLDPYTSRRRLTANLAWVTIGVLLLSILYFQGSRAPTHLTLSMAGFAIMLFYFIGSVKSRRLIFSGDLGSFETVGGRLKRVNIANNCLESFKNARMIMLGDRAVLGASTLFVVTWTLGVMVLYFWQKALQGDGSDWNFSKWAGIIWIGLTAGRIVGNSLAVLPDVAAPNVKARRLALGAWLAGGSMILFFAWRFMIHKTEWRFLDMWTLPLAVLLIFVNRIGQEIVLPFAYARIHESRHVLIAQNRASVESLLAVWTTPPLLITWGMVFMFEKWFHHPATLIVLVFGVLGLLLVLSSLLNKPLVRAVSDARQVEAKTA